MCVNKPLYRLVLLTKLFGNGHMTRLNKFHSYAIYSIVQSTHNLSNFNVLPISSLDQNALLNVVNQYQIISNRSRSRSKFFIVYKFILAIQWLVPSTNQSLAQKEHSL